MNSNNNKFGEVETYLNENKFGEVETYLNGIGIASENVSEAIKEEISYLLKRGRLAVSLATLNGGDAAKEEEAMASKIKAVISRHFKQKIAAEDAAEKRRKATEMAASTAKQQNKKTKTAVISNGITTEDVEDILRGYAGEYACVGGGTHLRLSAYINIVNTNITPAGGYRWIRIHLYPSIEGATRAWAKPIARAGAPALDGREVTRSFDIVIPLYPWVVQGLNQVSPGLINYVGSQYPADSRDYGKGASGEMDRLAGLVPINIKFTWRGRYTLPELVNLDSIQTNEFKETWRLGPPMIGGTRFPSIIEGVGGAAEAASTPEPAPATPEPAPAAPVPQKIGGLKVQLNRRT